MSLELINTNFSTLNTSLELLRQSNINQSVTQQLRVPWTNFSNGSLTIDTFENGVKKYRRIIITGEGTHNGELPTIIFQEAAIDNDWSGFFSDGIKFNLVEDIGGRFTFFFESPHVALRYCRLFSKSRYLSIKMTGIKYTL